LAAAQVLSPGGNGGAAPALLASLVPSAAGSLAVAPAGTPPGRLSTGIREHPVLAALCVFLTLLVLTVPLWVVLPFIMGSPFEFPRSLADDDLAAPIAMWILFGLGLSLVTCAWAFLWRRIAPTPALLAARQAAGSSVGGTVGRVVQAIAQGRQQGAPRTEPARGGCLAVLICAALVLLALVFGGIAGGVSGGAASAFLSESIGALIGVGVGFAVFVPALGLFLFAYYRRSR
jgi:hypothetical protein